MTGPQQHQPAARDTWHSRRPRLTRAGELHALAALAERDLQGMARIGQLLERSTRLMDITTQEFYEAQVVVDNTQKPIYLTQETTRVIVVDCWSKVEEHLRGAYEAFNASEDEPHARALALLQGLNEAARYADVIYVLTPMPDEEIEGA